MDEGSIMGIKEYYVDPYKIKYNRKYDCKPEFLLLMANKEGDLYVVKNIDYMEYLVINAVFLINHN